MAQRELDWAIYSTLPTKVIGGRVYRIGGRVQPRQQALVGARQIRRTGFAARVVKAKRKKGYRIAVRRRNT